jgi:hypothetical protein
MAHILAESEITRDNLAEQLENAGWVVELDEDHIGLRSEGGLYFTLHLDTERRFVRLYCYLPFRHDFDDQLELVNTLNSEVFLAGFSLVDDRSLLRIVYQMSYHRGLILPQFTRLVRQYEGIIDYVRSTFDADRRIFARAGDDTEAETDDNPNGPPEERVLQ